MEYVRSYTYEEYQLLLYGPLGSVRSGDNASRGYKHQEKRRYIKAILSDEETRHALKIARPSSRAMKLCYVPLRLGNVTLASFMGWSITLVKTKFSTFFYNMRSKTVHECEISR